MGRQIRPGTNEMNRVCVDRHNGFVNSVFADWSVRKVGLKELWTLKWHRTYNTNGHVDHRQVALIRPAGRSG